MKSFIPRNFSTYLAIFLNVNYFVSIFLFRIVVSFSSFFAVITLVTFINSSSCPIRDCVLERPILVGNKRCIRYAPAGAVALSFRTIKSICIQPRPRFNSTKRNNCSSNDEMNLTAGSTERFLRPRARSIELKLGRASRCARWKATKANDRATSIKSCGFARHDTSSIRFFSLCIQKLGA